ncbi:MAG: molybdopterin dinucleotide binding domain-containing protein [Sulfobacillus sp.]
MVLDPRLSNTASHADDWLALWPGTEGVFLLGVARVLIEEKLFDQAFLERWCNWREFLSHEGDPAPTFERFVDRLKEIYALYTPEFVAAETGVEAETLLRIARQIGEAGHQFAAHIWRAAAAANLGGWTIARCLFFLNVLTGSVGTEGGTSPNLSHKFVPHPPVEPPPVKGWNTLTWPAEFPLAHNEMSFLLPHFLKEHRGKLSLYFTRVYNPVWTNPDGFSWIDMLSDPDQVGLHVALTPTWNETAQFADLVLPMGLSPERHDLLSYETHAGQWIGFRQPIARVLAERRGESVRRTYEVNPGEVWEENEWWIDLSWRIDPDGSLGIRKNFMSPYRDGEQITVSEYYRWIFEHSVPGLPEAAAKEGLSPLAYMQKYSAFEISRGGYREYEQPVPPQDLDQAFTDPETGIIYSPTPAPARLDIKPAPRPADRPEGRRVGVRVGDDARRGFPTPSGKLEFFSATLAEWGWPELAIPAVLPSHVHQQSLRPGQFVLNSTFRLPTLIHTRSGNSKWLYEISHRNPVLIHTQDAARLGLASGDLVRVTTEIGHFVDRVWVTEGIHPGIIACSHHLGRWRIGEQPGVDRWASASIGLQRSGEGVWRMRTVQEIAPFASSDRDSTLIWWKQGGVHQNLTFPVHPDPVSGMHCWHQAVDLEKANADDRYGDVEVDTAKAHQVYARWMEATRPGPGPGGLRRPQWLLRPLRPAPEAYRDPAAPTTPGRSS